MIIFRHIQNLQQYLSAQTANGATVGFVPTMGALHEGHISLINRAKQDAPLVVSSIFVNPTQFNDPKDFEKYPITVDQDVYQLEKAGCDVLFLPSVAEMYPEGVDTVSHHYDLGTLESVLDGKFRPGHFQGVCRVVHKLLDIVQPHWLYLGQKDYQQCLVIARLVALLEMNAHIVVCPTSREADGLAMSSRNRRLTPDERTKAPALYRTLQKIRQQLRPGSIQTILDAAIGDLTAEGFIVDYVAIADAENLALLQEWDGERPLVALVAAFIGEVRLIDNLLLN